jgi:glutamate N-acetyltransferase/amino-acid N-acetyltransferase
LRKALREAVDGSFNRITVDGGMSTNDTALIFANNAVGGALIKTGSSAYKKFTALLKELSLRLAHMIVRDGEGATKFVELTVKGAASVKMAERAARTLAHSILVKTALFGGDPNWGRIISELGAMRSTDIRLNPDKTDIIISGVKVFARGLDTGKEGAASRVMKKRDVELTVDLKSGKGAYTLWTTDLSYGYVKLNSQYRT